LQLLFDSEPAPAPAQAKRLVADLLAFFPAVSSIAITSDASYDEQLDLAFGEDEESWDRWGVLMAELAASPLRLRELLFMVVPHDSSLMYSALAGIEQLIEQGLSSVGLVMLEPWMCVPHLSACTNLTLRYLCASVHDTAALRLPALRHLHVHSMSVQELPHLMRAHLPALRSVELACYGGKSGSLVLPPAEEQALFNCLRELAGMDSCPPVRDGAWTVEWRTGVGATGETMRRPVGPLTALPSVWERAAREPSCAGLLTLTLVGCMP